MRRLVVCLPIVLALSFAADRPATGAPGPPRPTPDGAFDAFPAAAIVETIGGGPAGDPIGVAVLGLGRLTLPPNASFELTGPQVLAVAAGFPLATPVVGAATIGRLPGTAGDPERAELAEGRRGRLGPGEWLLVGAGGVVAIENDGVGAVVVFVALVGGGPGAG